MKIQSIEKELDNSIKVILIPMKNTDTISFGVFSKVGSRYESKKTSGIAHFLEHMIFKGTSHLSSKKVAESLDSVGARYNAETSYETTHYYVSGHKDNIGLFIDIIGDIYLFPAFREEDIIMERGVVNEELNMIKDEPSEIIQNLLHETVFSNSSLKYPIIGTKKNIMSFTRKDFIDFKKKFYSTNRTVIVVAGNFNQDKIYKKIKKRFEVKKKNNSNNIFMQIDDMPTQVKPNLIFKENSDLSQSQIIISFNAESIFSKYFETYDLIADILTSGSSSRLFELLRNKLGIVYSVSALNLAYSHEGVFIIQMGVDNNRIKDAVKYTLKELVNLVKEGVSQKELDKAKNIRITSTNLGMETPLNIMNYYGLNELYFNVDTGTKKDYTLETIIKKYESIKKNNIDELIRNLFSKQKLNIFVYGKKKNIKLDDFKDELEELE